MKMLCTTLLSLLLASAAFAQFDAPIGGPVFGGDAPESATTVELVSEVTSIKPGSTFDVGLRLTMDEHWHTYWIYAGDAGEPTTIKWNLPEGFTAGDIQWPTPIRFVTGPEEYKMAGFGYEKKTLLVVSITAPAEIAEKKIEIKGLVEWLECDDETCVPGDQQVSLTLPVGDGALDEAEAKAFAAIRETFTAEADGWDFYATEVDGKIALDILSPKDIKLKAVQFLTTNTNQFDLVAQPEWITIGPNRHRLIMGTNEYAEGMPEQVTGILTGIDNSPLPGGQPSVWVKSKPFGTEAPPPAEGEAITPPTAAAAAETSALSLPAILFFFILGGMLLNLMPCIFPVLAIKILGFVKQAEEGGTHAWKHGLVFGVGVIISFWVLVAVLLAVRAIFDVDVGWGSQLQQPAVMIGFAFLFVILAANLFGVFEMGTSLTGVGQEATNKSGYLGSFNSGILATLVATPCTGPLLGAPVAAAMGKPALIAILLFTALGFGMALPYIVFSSSPRLLKLLPRPGAWMKSFKIIMGFLMLLAATWAVWTAWAQIPEGFNQLWLLVGLVMAAFACWLYGHYNLPQNSKRTRYIGIAAALAVVVVGYALPFKGPLAESMTPADPADGPQVVFAAWSPEAEAEARAAGRPVFVDYTARWCQICQFNKPTMKSQAVAELVEQKNVAMFRADWTRREKNGAIFKRLQSFGRVGVPAYPLYNPEVDQPVLLPNALYLNKGTFLDALRELPDAPTVTSSESNKKPAGG